MNNRLELAQKLFKGVGVELGVAAGKFSATILDKCRHLRRLYSIDRWTDHHGLSEYMAAAAWLQGMCWAANHADGKFPADEAVVLRKLPPTESIVLRMTFSEAAPMFEAGSLDFIYIDGYAHTGQEHGRTLREWWPKLKPGGVFAGHDYCAGPEGRYKPTMDAVDAFVVEQGLVGALQVTEETSLEHPSWWVIKPL